MSHKIVVYGALCSTSLFTVNGITADSNDFGEQYDRDKEGAEDYACGDMHFTPKASTKEILTKYAIDEEEYQRIAGQLEEKLSFGRCGWCV